VSNSSIAADSSTVALRTSKTSPQRLVGGAATIRRRGVGREVFEI